jgi:hypothetical protein
LGNANFILGMRITRDRKNKLLYLDQQVYIDKILNRYQMNDCKTVDTPGTELKLLKYNEDDPTINLNQREQNLYQQLTGSVLYAALSTRPDIIHSVGIVSRYNSKPQITHLNAAKRIYRYLCGTKHYKLILDGKAINNDNPISLITYADSDWAGDPEKCKSTSGYIIKLNNAPISWISRKQRTIAKSSCEAEIIASGEAIQELQWIRNFLIELQVLNSNDNNPSIVYCDNKAATMISNQDLANTKTKHIAVHYNYINEAVNNNEVKLKWISSSEQQADIFTKPLGKVLFNKFTKSMLMGEC